MIDEEDKRKIFAVRMGCLFFVLVWITLTIVAGNYSHSYDKLYLSELQNSEARVPDINKTTDFKEAVVAHHDASGTYAKVKWRLQHPEIYYIKFAIVFGIITFIFCVIFVGWLEDRHYW